MAAYLLPALRRGTLRLVGEANPSELEIARQRLPGFIDCFETLRLPEMDSVRARRVLDLFAGHAKNTLSIDIERPALDTGYRLLGRYVRYDSFPGKAVRFFGDCVREAIAGQTGVVTEAAAIAHFAKAPACPRASCATTSRWTTRRCTASSQKLFGQDAAIGHLKDVVYLFKAGLERPCQADRNPAVRRADRRRQDRGGQGAGALLLRCRWRRWTRCFAST